ncbi:MAG: malate synthase [Thermoleophilaceae bacterium]|jgi:malate synthase|nr:malate synthase [Thermoleophilaceae bacterium]
MSVEIHAPVEGRHAEVLTGEALEFVAGLHREFNARREELVGRRAERVARWNAGALPDFLPETEEIRASDWRVAPPPPDLRDRRVEITGPTDRKMVINALNSGARGFMADFEDSLSPTWGNVVGGHVNLTDAIEGTIEHEENGKRYSLGDERATLLVRPRGWHLTDRHITIDGAPVSAGLMDFGLHLFHNARRLLERGSGPYFYLPKMESHLEARLWNDVFVKAQEELGLDRGTIRATVLIETVPAAFEMDEILYELRDHSAGLNAGRWDYIFSMIKCFRDRPEFLLPDRVSVTMTVPFMRAYTLLLVKTCHRRGAHAMGGMSAVIPSRKDPAVNEKAFAAVRADKEREAGDGFDGTWVAHPDSVPVAMDRFDAVLGERPNQVDRQRDDVTVAASDLLDVAAAGGEITEGGLRNDVNVGIQYISSWLRGNGAAAINHLMEDAATAEIARSQVWQWIRHGAEIDGRRVTPELVRRIEDEELEKIREQVGDEFFESQGRPRESRELFEDVALSDGFQDFLTIPAYERLDD